MNRWAHFDTDEGGVLWGILCCWLAVCGNLILLAFGVPIDWIVPLDLFGVPILASLTQWLASRLC
jgi:hypothetical protein